MSNDTHGVGFHVLWTRLLHPTIDPRQPVGLLADGSFRHALEMRRDGLMEI